MLIYTDVEPTPEDVEFWRDSETYNNYENYCCQTKERIKQDPKFAFKYAEKLGGLPQEWEKVFLKSPEYAFYYSYFVRHKKLNPNIEIVFAQSAEWAYKYARNVRGKLPKKIEKAFLKCPEYALKYAQLTGRLEEKIEAVFLKNCEFAYLYAKIGRAHV